MNGYAYLQQVIHKYEPTDLSHRYFDIMALHSKLKEWANGYFVNIFESGSRAKGTAISLASDVDYVVSLTFNSPETLKEIYLSCYNWLAQFYRVRMQNVSIRVDLNGLKVDITPAKKWSGNTNYHSIFVSKTQSWKQTNIHLHINDIKNSGRINEIKLTKIWRELNGIDFPSIYLEYLLITKILKNKPLNNLENNFYCVLQRLSNEQKNPLFSRIADPSNANNILSDLLNQNEKIHIIKKARESIAKRYWNEIVF